MSEYQPNSAEITRPHQHPEIIDLGNKRMWRIISWPVLVWMGLFLVLVPHWTPQLEAWANEPPVWDESQIPIEWSVAKPSERTNGQVNGRGMLELANQLGNHPVAIYEYVRNQISFEAYSGSRFGAVGTLERGRGNDIDQAFLLAALLRAAYRNLRRAEPELAIVIGDVRLTGEQALSWLDVSNRQSLINYLQSANIGYSIQPSVAAPLGSRPQAAGFDLILHNHVWLRGDLAFGAMRGARLAEEEQGVKVDLDPSIVPLQVGSIKNGQLLSGIDPVEFVDHLKPFIAIDAARGAARNIPETMMLQQIDAGSSLLRQLLKSSHLSLDEVLHTAEPTISRIDALPAALPYLLEKMPVAYSLRSPADRATLLDRVRQRVQLRVLNVDGNGAPLVDTILPLSETYGGMLSLSFAASTAATGDDLTRTTVSGAWKQVTPQLELNHGPLGIGSAPGVTYGTSLLLEIACQGTDLSSSLRQNPAFDPTVTRQQQKVLAGGCYALAVLPGLNAKTADIYYQDAIARIQRTAGGDPLSASQGVAPLLGLVTQIALTESEVFGRLAAGVNRCLAVQNGDWVLAGMEALPVDSGWSQPQFVFAGSAAPVAVGALDTTGSMRLASVRDTIQIIRSAALGHAAALGLGEMAEPVTAGRLLRANNQSAAWSFLVNEKNSSQLQGDSVRIPDCVRGNPEAMAQLNGAAANGELLLPAAQTMDAHPQGPAPLGLGWGYYSHQTKLTPGNWSSTVYTTTGGLQRQAYSPQLAGSPITPDLLIHPAEATIYEPFATQELRGVEAYRGAMVQTAQAMAVASEPAAELLQRGAGTALRQSDVASLQAAGVILIEAVLGEFSRPEVEAIEVEVRRVGSASSHRLAENEPFNPALCDKVIVHGRFNQIMDTSTFRLKDGTYDVRATKDFSGITLGNGREIQWILKDESQSGVENHLAFTSSNGGYNGAIRIELEGSVNGQSTKPIAVEEIIDSALPVVALNSRMREGQHRGTVSIRGMADDTNFKQYQIMLASGEQMPQAAGPWRILTTSQRSVGSMSVLTCWDGKSVVPPLVDANGTFTLKLKAEDLAGNIAETVLPVSALNDRRVPTISIESPQASPLRGIVPLSVHAADNQPYDSKLKRLKIWVEYLSSLKTQSDGNVQSGALGYEQATLAELNWTTQSPSAYQYQAQLDTSRYQFVRNGVGGVAKGLPHIKIHAQATDQFDNQNESVQSFDFNNILFGVKLNRYFLIRNEFEIIAQTFDNDSILPTVEVLDVPKASNGFSTTTLGTLTPEPGSPAPIGEQYIESWTTTFRLTGNESFMKERAEGWYALRFTKNRQVKTVRIKLIPRYWPMAAIQEPMLTLLFKNRSNNGHVEPGIVPITGIAYSSELAAAGSLSPAENAAPIGQKHPAERPFWQLAYKPHDLPPGDLGSEPKYGDTMPYEGNWKEIAHGFSSVHGAFNSLGFPETTTMTLWNLAGIAPGYYDLRLVVTDGARYITKYAYPYQVLSDELPGDPPVGDPGALKLRQVDFKVDFQGFPIEVAREYDSHSAGELRDFGFGWKLDGGFTLKMDKRNDRSSPFGRSYQIDLTLPDGRTYLYANRPMQTPGEWAFNAWWRCNAFMERPYGQMLWVPGEDEEMLDYKQVFGNQFEIYDAPGTQRVLEYKIRHQLNTYLNGDIACLELENGENLLFDFYSGKLLERQNADGSQRLEFSELTSDGWTPIQNAFGGHDTQIKDKLGRQIVIRRDQNDLVREIIDPRGRAVTYEYNNLSELTGVVNRLGERKVFRYKASPPHYLAAMDIRQQGSNNQLITQTINYDYTSEGRLSNMAVGDTAIRMDYSEGAAGTGGTQTITDEATGGQSNVVYDAEGRVLRMDQGGVPTQYEYFNKADTLQEQLTTPVGAIAKQVTGGVESTFSYDLQPYQPRYFGYEGIALQMIQGAMSRATNDELQWDFDDSNFPNQTMKSGYLTSQQLQPTRVSTPAVGADHVAHGTQTVQLDYDNHQRAIKPDGSGKVHSVTDPEGRGIGLGYGSGASRNQTTSLDGPGGSHVDNSYLSGGLFAGELSESLTWRQDGATSTILNNTKYEYSTTTLRRLNSGQSWPMVVPKEVFAWGNYRFDKGTTGVLDRISAATSDVPALAAVVDALGSATLVVNQVRPQSVAGQDSTPASTVSYRDGLDATILTLSGIYSLDAHTMSVSIPDAEGRELCRLEWTGSATFSFQALIPTYDVTWTLARRALTRYDPAGLVLGTQEDAWETSGTQRIRHTTEQRNSYDDVGRQVKTERRVDHGAWRTTVQTVYATFVGGRSVTQIDSAGNKSITLTDDAGRTVEERVEGVKGAQRWTRYGYDSYGRRNLVRDSRGLQTSSAFDAAGREVQTTVLAEGRSYVTRKGYDAAGRLVWQKDPQQAATTDTAHPSGFYTTYLYKIDKDAQNPITTWTSLDDVENVDNRTYGQLVETFYEDIDTNPNNNNSYAGYYEKYVYDDQGRQTDVSKPATITTTTETTTTEVVTRTEYDDQGRVAAVIFNCRAGLDATSTTNVRFSFAYDSKGNRSKVIYPSGIEKTWKYEYEAGTDQLKRLTESQPGATGAAPTFKDTLYDAQGRVASVTNGNGHREDDIYNTDGQLVRKLYRTSGMSDAVLNVMFGYDVDGRQTSVKQSTGSATDGKLYAERTTYDTQSGQAEKINKIIDGIALARLNYGYDANNSLSSLSVLGRTAQYGYDMWGRLLSVNDGQTRMEYTYALCGKKATVTNYGDGTVESFVYDSRGNLKSITQKKLSDASIILKLEYVLSVDGNRVGIVETDQVGAITTKKYEYDQLGRLTREKERSGANPATWSRNVAYAYDADSNRTLVDDVVAGSSDQYLYYANSQRLYQIKRGGKLYQEFTWTNNGEQAIVATFNAAGTEAVETQTCTWNPDGTLQSVIYVGGNNDKLKAEYQYDHTGTLIARKVSKQDEILEWERYLVDNQNLTGYSQVLATFNVDPETGENKLKRLNLISDQIVEQDDYAGEKPYVQYLHGDTLGSVRTVNRKGDNGALDVTKLNYTAFGETKDAQEAEAGAGGATATRPTEYAFTGQMKDALTGMQYHRARWYEIGTGSWKSTDIELDLFGNQANAVSYCGQNAINNADLSGMMSLGETVSVIGTLSSLTRISVWGIEQTQAALGITLLSNSNVEAIRSILDIVDWITLPFDIFQGFKFLANLLSKPGGLRRIGTIYSMFKPGGSAYSAVTTGFMPVEKLVSKAINYIPELGKLPEELYDVTIAIGKITQEAREIFRAKDWAKLKILYGDSSHVSKFLDMIHAMPRPEFWKIRIAAGNAIHAIVFRELQNIKKSNAFKDIIESINQVHVDFIDRPDVVIRDAKTGVAWVLDVTASKSAGKAGQKYGEEALDILYDSFESVSEFF